MPNKFEKFTVYTTIFKVAYTHRCTALCNKNMNVCW